MDLQLLRHQTCNVTVKGGKEDFGRKYQLENTWDFEVFDALLLMVELSVVDGRGRGVGGEVNSLALEMPSYQSLASYFLLSLESF